MFDFRLVPGHTTPTDGLLVNPGAFELSGNLVPGHSNTADGLLVPNVFYQTVAAGGGPVFPTQYSGLRIYYGGIVNELCLVAEADAPAAMGGTIKVNKNGTLYAVYLVETADTDASSVRLKTSTGTKSIRLKT